MATLEAPFHPKAPQLELCRHLSPFARKGGVIRLFPCTELHPICAGLQL
jgi:hypothetical protein